jgi:hypothetical protein
MKNPTSIAHSALHGLGCPSVSGRRGDIPVVALAIVADAATARLVRF